MGELLQSTFRLAQFRIAAAPTRFSTGRKRTSGSQEKLRSALPNLNRGRSLKSVLRNISKSWSGARYETWSHRGCVRRCLIHPCLHPRNLGNRARGIDPDGLLNLISRGLVVPEFSLAEEIEAIQHLMKTYRNVPMSLADACLVRMTEAHENSKVMTLDSDFVVYRKSRRRVIPLLRPER